MSVFVKETLTNGDEVVVQELFGSHLMSATRKMGNDIPGTFPYYLLCELVFVNGKAITLKYLEKLRAEDLCLLLDIVNAQMEKLK